MRSQAAARKDNVRSFEPYVLTLQRLVHQRLQDSSDVGRAAVLAALDGQAGRELRRLVELSELRRAGAFFTGSQLSALAVAPFAQSLSSASVIVDPACGAGDLLLACARHLGPYQSLEETLRHWGRQLRGTDLHAEFIAAAKARLTLAAIEAVGKAGDAGDVEMAFSGIRVGDGLDAAALIDSASHIVLNPPYVATQAGDACEWAQGNVNSAALFVEKCLRAASPGARMICILPDVLRSGARYDRWRKFVEAKSRDLYVRLSGQFDDVTDVHVFILDLVVDNNKVATRQTPLSPPERDADVIADHFTVNVGAVVDYRDPRRGPWHPFLHARSVRPWSIVRDIPERRRFEGTVFGPPFVVIRRTSRPGDQYRATASIVTAREAVAVENHLLVLRPKDGALQSCKDALAVLRDERTTAWLDQRIRCRHLTVGAVSSLPYWRS